MNREFVHADLAPNAGSVQVALARVAEEAAELTKEAMKALRFGLANRYPADGPTNAAKIVAEFEDIRAALADARIISLAMLTPVAAVSPVGEAGTGWKCSKCGFETQDNQDILKVSPVVNGVRYLTCPACAAVGEFVDSPADDAERVRDAAKRCAATNYMGPCRLALGHDGYHETFRGEHGEYGALSWRDCAPSELLGDPKLGVGAGQSDLDDGYDGLRQWVRDSFDDKRETQVAKSVNRLLREVQDLRERLNDCGGALTEHADAIVRQVARREKAEDDLRRERERHNALNQNTEEANTNLCADVQRLEREAAELRKKAANVLALCGDDGGDLETVWQRVVAELRAAVHPAAPQETGNG